MKKGWTNYFGERGDFVGENAELDKIVDDKMNVNAKNSTGLIALLPSLELSFLLYSIIC